MRRCWISGARTHCCGVHVCLWFWIAIDPSRTADILSGRCSLQDHACSVELLPMRADSVGAIPCSSIGGEVSAKHCQHAVWAVWSKHGDKGPAPSSSLNTPHPVPEDQSLVAPCPSAVRALPGLCGLRKGHSRTLSDSLSPSRCVDWPRQGDAAWPICEAAGRLTRRTRPIQWAMVALFALSCAAAQICSGVACPCLDCFAPFCYCPFCYCPCCYCPCCCCPCCCCPCCYCPCCYCPCCHCCCYCQSLSVQPDRPPWRLSGLPRAPSP